MPAKASSNDPSKSMGQTSGNRPQKKSASNGDDGDDSGNSSSDSSSDEEDLKENKVLKECDYCGGPATLVPFDMVWESLNVN
jgi:hypothetical protein